MARYAQGQPCTVYATVTNNATPPVLIDAGTLTLTVQKPDASTQSYTTPTHDGVGKYHQDIPTADINLIGHYQYKWVSTGTGAGVTPGEFDVYDPFEVSVLSLQDAKNMIDIPQTTTTFDAQIYQKVATIEANIEKMIGGPIITRTIANERVKVMSGYRSFAVRYRPLVAVTSIVDVASGAAQPLTDLDVDFVTGVIRRKLQLPFWSRGPYYLITYTAGLGTAVPPAVAEAASVILQHLWETQRGMSSAPPWAGEQTVTLPGWGFAVPNRAVELLSPYAMEVYV
jgi:hypothetical protein